MEVLHLNPNGVDTTPAAVRPTPSAPGDLFLFVILGKPAVQKNRKVIVPISRQCPACRMSPKRTLADNKEHRAWKESAHPQLREQWNREPIPRKVQVKVRLDCYIGARQRPDVDGIASGPMDALQHAGILENDYSIDELHVTRQRDPERPRIEITLWVPQGALDA